MNSNRVSKLVKLILPSMFGASAFNTDSVIIDSNSCSPRSTDVKEICLQLWSAINLLMSIVFPIRRLPYNTVIVNPDFLYFLSSIESSLVLPLNISFIDDVPFLHKSINRN